MAVVILDWSRYSVGHLLPLTRSRASTALRLLALSSTFTAPLSNIRRWRFGHMDPEGTASRALARSPLCQWRPGDEDLPGFRISGAVFCLHKTRLNLPIPQGRLAVERRNGATTGLVDNERKPCALFRHSPKRSTLKQME